MRRLAEASGIATPTRAELARFDRSRKNFGANGQRVLDGLVGSLDREVILASLSGHVRLRVDQLGDALRLELRETDRMLLADLLDEHDTLTRRVSEFDRYIDQALVSYAGSVSSAGNDPRHRPNTSSADFAEVDHRFRGCGSPDFGRSGAPIGA